MKSTTNKFTFSTSIPKRGKLGLSKSPEVITCAYGLKADDKAEFIQVLTAKIEEAETERLVAVRRYSRTNRINDAQALIRINTKLSAYSEALMIASRI